MTTIDTIVVIDTETTGTDPAEGAALLEVAAVPVSRTPEGGWSYGEVGSWHSTMVEHDGPIPPEARAVHHISPEQVRPGAPGAISRQQMIHGLLAAESPEEMFYAAHNAPFDRQFLPELKLPWICTYQCARHIWPEAPGYSNQVLRYWLGIETPAEMLSETALVRVHDSEELRETTVPLAPHRALYDTAVTAGILARMLETHTPEELVRLTGEPVLLQTIRFGKHRGQRFSDVPRDYLSWLLSKSDMCRDDADLRHTVRHHLGLD